MLEQILKTINNYFYRTGEKGTYVVKDNEIEVKGKYLVGQYIKIEGSILNDGVFKVTNISGNKITINEGIDEAFLGCIYGLSIPKEIVKLEAKIREFENKVSNSVYISESNGQYSYTKATDKNGNIQTWENAFANALKPYRRITDGKRRINLC